MHTRNSHFPLKSSIGKTNMATELITVTDTGPHAENTRADWDKLRAQSIYRDQLLFSSSQLWPCGILVTFCQIMPFCKTCQIPTVLSKSWVLILEINSYFSQTLSRPTLCKPNKNKWLVVGKMGAIKMCAQCPPCVEHCEAYKDGERKVLTLFLKTGWAVSYTHLRAHETS